jgi:hypothetical protein
MYLAAVITSLLASLYIQVYKKKRPKPERVLDDIQPHAHTHTHTHTILSEKDGDLFSDLRVIWSSVGIPSTCCFAKPGLWLRSVLLRERSRHVCQALLTKVYKTSETL